MDIPTLVKLTDLSCVHTEHSEEDIRDMAAVVKKYGFICAFTLPAHTPLMLELLKDRPEIMVGGNVGFPDGSATTRCKVAEARELVEMGVHELDMVVNVGWLRSGKLERVEDDLRAVVSAVDKPVKVILECHYLTNEQIVAGCEAAIRAGATFIKTGTGWAPTGATLENTRLILDTVRGRCKVKASGGIRDMATIDAMRAAGVHRFGIGMRAAAALLGI